MAEALARGNRDVVSNLYGVLVPPNQSEHDQHEDSEDSSSQPEYGMAPPPDMAFDSREKLLEYLKNWAASQGYAVVIGRSRTNRLWIRCDRGGLYHDKHQDDPTQRQRKRKISRLTGCEFSVKASMRKDGIWRSRTENGDHNHEPSSDLREHPSLRRMNEEQLQYVYQLTEQGMTPADIMTELTRRWPDIKVIRRDIYNARKNYKSFKDTGNEPPREYEDPNGRMPGPTDNGRWAWVEDGDEIKKKRRIGRPPKERETVAVSSQNVPTVQLPVASDAFSGNLAAPMTSTSQPQQTETTWNQLANDSTANQPSAIQAQVSTFQPPPTTSNFALGNRISLRTPQNDFHSNFGGVYQNTGNTIYDYTQGSHTMFPQQTLGTDRSDITTTSSTGSAMVTRQFLHQNAQSYIHPSLRSRSGTSDSHSSITPRQEPTAQIASQLQSQYQPAAIQDTTYTNLGEILHMGSQPSNGGIAPLNHDSGNGSGPNSLNAAQTKPSGAAMIQRLSRVEEELKDQKTELREQKDLLTKILAAVHSLKG